MALLSGGPRTATVRSVAETDLLEIGREDFERLIASDPAMARAVERLSHERAISNLSSGGSDPSTWAKVASNSLDHVSRAEANKMLTEAGHGAGMAIVFGNILDTIPGCLVIGAKFNGLASLSLTLMLGMFLGGIPEAAASAAMLTQSRLPSQSHLCPLGDRPARRRGGRGGGQDVHRQLRIAGSDFLRKRWPEEQFWR